jgi:hypothetical protein
MDAAVIRLFARILVLHALFAAAPVFAQADRELEIKAAYVYKFGSFVEWPPSAFAGPDGAFIIGVIGADALAAELERVVSGRPIQDRSVVVRRLRRGEPFGRLHVLFVGQAEAARLPEILAAAKGHGVLTVTETDNALAQGSMINFVAVEHKVRFDVALPPAERDKLKISARLLAVARKVVTG